jgi:tetratricopeptide (TPR) repeat protein
LNEEIFISSQDRSWQEIQDQAERAFTGLVTRVERLPEKAFANQEEIVWQTMACGGKHPYRHLAEFSWQQGDVEQATLLYEELIEVMRHMPLPLQELGRAIYQQACFYAMMGQTTRAIEGLSLAIRLEPRAVEWSKQDNTLDALRSLPAFQTLFEQF